MMQIHFTSFNNTHFIQYLLSSHFESYFKVRLKLNSFLPEVTLYISERKITASALVNSAFVPEYCVGRKRTKKYV